jgi:hypothetical protein
MVLSEAMARGLMKLGSNPTRISNVDITVYTAQSLHARSLADFDPKGMEISIRPLGLEISNALVASGKRP